MKRLSTIAGVYYQTTILFETHWDTCSTNHQQVQNQDVYKMVCMIQYPCSNHASSPSLPHQAMLVYSCPLFTSSALSLTTLILGVGNRGFITKCPNTFIQDWSYIYQHLINGTYFSNKISCGLSEKYKLNFDIKI